MFVYKCDMCIKEIEPDQLKIEVSVNEPYARLTFCGECGGPVISFLHLKELIPISRELDPELQ
jgi:DNA-directed RNA polymerase subunit RPC12/RpoP